MSNYLIIDSNKLYAAKLYKALTDSDVDAGEYIIDTANFANASKIFDVVNPKIKDNSKKIILINAETELKDKYLQHQPIIELAFWIRCRYNSVNPIVFYSGVSVNHSLKQNPENFILLSPNCYYYKLPITRSKIEAIKKLKPIEDVDLKPYLKPAISLEQVRHRYANYAGMALMLAVARGKHKIDKDSEIITGTSPLFEFKNTLDYHILKTFYNLQFKRLATHSKDSFVPQTKKVLLIDDLAADGWKEIISQMLYGLPNATEMETVKIHPNNKTGFDEKKTIEELETQIKTHKPHLILLDLRLNDEEGRKHLSELGGYKLLSHLKKSPLYKGVPVIMFTASSNAQTVKQLIGCGAYCVWTKPGIDEGLTANGIIKRYDQLLLLVSEVFNGIDTGKLVSLNNKEYTKEKLSFEAIREDLLSQTQYVKYRCELQDLKNQSHYFSPFSDIFIDTNFLMSGFNHGNAESVDFAESILNVYKLVHICKEFEHTIQVNGITQQVKKPKVIFINNVLDEVLELSKITDETQPKRWKRAYLGYSIIRSFFDEFARTEFNNITGSGSLKSELNYIIGGMGKDADDPLIETIINILSGNEYTPLRNRNNLKLKYLTVNPNVLLLTNEQRTGQGSTKKIPYKLQEKYKLISNPKGQYTLLRLNEFNEIMNKILL